MQKKKILVSPELLLTGIEHFRQMVLRMPHFLSLNMTIKSSLIPKLMEKKLPYMIKKSKVFKRLKIRADPHHRVFFSDYKRLFTKIARNKTLNSLLLFREKDYSDGVLYQTPSIMKCFHKLESVYLSFRVFIAAEYQQLLERGFQILKRHRLTKVTFVTISDFGQSALDKAKLVSALRRFPRLKSLHLKVDQNALLPALGNMHLETLVLSQYSNSESSQAYNVLNTIRNLCLKSPGFFKDLTDILTVLNSNPFLEDFQFTLSGNSHNQENFDLSQLKKLKKLSVNLNMECSILKQYRQDQFYKIT